MTLYAELEVEDTEKQLEQSPDNFVTGSVNTESQVTI